jgi:hypothetical protein
MTLRNFATPFASADLGVVPITISDGLGVTLDAPGTYTLRSITGWFIHDADEADVGDMTEVAPGDEHEIVVLAGESVVRYLKLDPARVGEVETVSVAYDPTDPVGPTLPGAGTFTLKCIDGVPTWVEDV